MSDTRNVPQTDEQLNEACAFLYRTVKTTDPETGAPDRVAESQIYRDYLENQRAYQNARDAYRAAFLTAQQTATGKTTWPLVAPTLQLPVKAAYSKWRSGFADKVEKYLATIASRK